MKGFYDPVVAEVRRIREGLLEEYGTWENYNKYLDEQRPILEAEGWHFETTEERNERFARSQASEA